MRAYFFLNQYISSIQCGIQAQHTTAEMFVKYQNDSTALSQQLWDWAQNHKTSILLNGGYSSALRVLITLFDHQQNPYPWAYFCEDEDAIGPLFPSTHPDGYVDCGGALTCVGIILPEKIYETVSELRKDTLERSILVDQIPVCGEWSPEEGVIWELSKWEYELCLELKKYSLAS